MRLATALLLSGFGLLPLSSPANEATPIESFVESPDSVFAESQAIAADTLTSQVGNEPTIEQAFQPTSYVCPTGGRCGSPCRACRQARLTGWTAAVELSALSPRIPMNDFRVDQDEAVAGVGVVFGREGHRGGGIRAKVWGIDSDDLRLRNNVNPTIVTAADFRAIQVDVDFYQRMWIGDTSLLVGVGPRAAGLRFGSPSAPTILAGAGAGVTAELRRAFYRTQSTEIALVGSGELSMLTGELEDGPTQLLHDASITIGEAAFGVESRHQWGRGDLVFRYLFETQVWNATAFDEVGLIGSRFQFGYQW